MNKTLYGNLENRIDDYKETAVIFHYLEKYFYNLDVINKFKEFGNLFFCAPINLPAGSKEELSQAFKRSFEKGYFNNPCRSVYRRGSVAKILHFATSIGYKNIVLLGVDLNTAPHFFDVEGFQVHPGGEKMSYTSKIVNTQLHETVDTSIHPITMVDVIEYINAEALQKKGICLYNGAATSSLMSSLPYYWRVD